jgi:hypothetical protein
MFEINTYLINKMGWLDYSPHRGIGHPQLFVDDEFTRHFIDLKSYKTCYLIKELSKDEKQKSEKLYKFIKMDYTINRGEFGIPEFEVTEFDSNYALLKLILKYESCNTIYQRHIKLLKLLK